MLFEIPLLLLQQSTGTSWSHMFTLDSTAFWLEKIVRPLIVYVALVVLIRIFGRRELAQLNPFDLVVILSLSNTVQNAIIGADNSVVGGLVGAIALLSINYFFAILKYNSKSFEHLVEGRSKKLIKDGSIVRREVRRELLTEDDLESIAHRSSFEKVGDMKTCIIDPNGSILVKGLYPTDQEKFRTDVMDKLNSLSDEIAKLQKAT